MILAYSIATPGEIELPRDVHVIRLSSIQCFYAEIPRRRIGGEPEMLRFFEINQELAAHTDIIEFRYPTALDEISDLQRFLAANETQLAAEMERLCGLAQLSVYLKKNAASNARREARSGTAYLFALQMEHQQAAAAANEVRALAGTDVRESIAQGDRLLLLLERDKVADTAARIRGSGFMVAGPFPPSGFAKLLS
jgi:hypothetical protein